MKQVSFSTQGAALSINMTYESNHAEHLYATYTYTLWEAQNNNIVDSRDGNNFNDTDDNYWLPTPASQNHKRIIDLLSRLKNAGEDTIKVRVWIEVCQDGHRLDKSFEEVSVPGNSSVSSQRFIQLIGQ